MIVEIVMLIVFLFFPVFVAKTFSEAGQNSYYALIPIFNYYIWLRIVRKPLWWFIFLLIPFINFFMIFLLVVETAKCYQKYKLGQQALAVVLFFYMLPRYGFSEKENFQRYGCKNSTTLLFGLIFDRGVVMIWGLCG